MNKEDAGSAGPALVEKGSGSGNPHAFDIRPLVVVVLLFSLLAALNAAFFAKEFSDERDYWTMAQNLVERGVLTVEEGGPSAFRPPLVAWVLAPFVQAGASMDAARVFFVLGYAVTGFLAGLLAAPYCPGSRWLPAFAAALVLAHPLYFLAAGNLFPQQILTPLLLAALYLTLRAARDATFKSALALGGATGLSVLATPSAVFSLLPIHLPWLAVDWKRFRSGRLPILTIVAGLTAAVIVGPYLLRNHLHVHPGIYLSLNSGLNLLMGNSPNTTTTSGVDVDLSAYPATRLPGESEFEQNQRLSHAAKENIRTDPRYYAGLYLRKFASGFDNTVITFTHGRSLGGSIVLWTYMSVVWFGFLAACLHRRPAGNNPPRPPRVPGLRIFAALVFVAYVMNVAGYAVFFTRLRFRLPLDVALAVVAAVGIFLVVTRFLASRASSPAEPS